MVTRVPLAVVTAVVTRALSLMGGNRSILAGMVENESDAAQGLALEWAGMVEIGRDIQTDL